jgi:hypothetical protein
MAARAPVRPATRCMRIVSRALASRIAGNMVAIRCANIDFPTSGVPGVTESEPIASISFPLTIRVGHSNHTMALTARLGRC